MNDPTTASGKRKASATEVAHSAFAASYRKSNMSLGADYGVANLGNLDEEVQDAGNPAASDESQEGKALKQIDKTRREILKQKQKIEINQKKKRGILPG